jgi:hypothetical protein
VSKRTEEMAAVKRELRLHEKNQWDERESRRGTKKTGGRREGRTMGRIDDGTPRFFLDSRD